MLPNNTYPETRAIQLTPKNGQTATESITLSSPKVLFYDVKMGSIFKPASLNTTE
jgi:hypothetical protein